MSWGRQERGWDQLGPSEAAGGSARAAGNDESVSSSLISNYFTLEGVIKCDNNVVSTYHCSHYLLFVEVMRALQPYPFEATVPKTKKSIDHNKAIGGSLTSFL